MQEQVTESDQRLSDAKARLKNSITKLDGLINDYNEKKNLEQTLRTQVIQDLDSYIENLETILEDN